MDKTLVIWFKDGATAYFEKVENLDETDPILTFDYFGVSSQVKRQAAFLKENIAGFAFEK